MEVSGVVGAGARMLTQVEPSHLRTRESMFCPWKNARKLVHTPDELRQLPAAGLPNMRLNSNEICFNAEWFDFVAAMHKRRSAKSHAKEAMRFHP
jgi:hypothetical protein